MNAHVNNPFEVPEPNAQFLDGHTPTIEWNGAKYPIPMLAPRQQRHVVPALMRSRHALLALSKNDADPLEEKDFDNLTNIVFWGLKRGHPTLTIEAFENVELPMISLAEMVQVIARQTGMFKPEVGNSATMGEAKAPMNHPTGTQSS